MEIDSQMTRKEISERVFRILKDISISPNKYIYDLSCANDSRKVNVAVETEINFDYQYLSDLDSLDIKLFAYIESYLCTFQIYRPEEVVFSLDRTIKNTNNSDLSIKFAQECPFFPNHLTNGYIPHGIAKSKSGRLLISLWNNKSREKSQGKVWKLNLGRQNFCEYEYDKSTPLFKCPTYITENGNGEICVSDEGAVVVLNEVGMLRFRYKGLTEDPTFDPYGICTDSSRNIIVADMKNDKIHMIDGDGGFVCYIQYENMEMPRALCVGKDNTLYVREWKSGSIKVVSLA
ncbi:uncharacterized protein LOC134256352 [Saccostrea cucullata]|uniref:uncharacterized protein LOC134256352 n=1 Tax=Saccostrea cuccullata TaxID=36930 RepID=UPI002ED6320C